MLEKNTQSIYHNKMKTRYDRIALLNDPLFKRRVAEVKLAKPEISSTELAEQLSKEYDMELSGTQLNNLIKNEMSIELTSTGSVEKNLTPFIKSIQKRFANLEKTTDKYHIILERLVDKLSEMEDIELIESIKDVTNIGKQVDNISKTLIAQINLVQSETDKLKVVATKGMVKMDDAIKDVDKYFIDLLRTLAEQRKITIHDDRLIKQALSSTKKEIHRIY